MRKSRWVRTVLCQLLRTIRSEIVTFWPSFFKRHNSVFQCSHYKGSRGHTVESRGEGTASTPSESATLYIRRRLRQVLLDNWAPCRLQPRRCCLRELITITQKFPR
ncbi:uncharacterized protein V6R79_024706 [Siganus canaliculatus]